MPPPNAWDVPQEASRTKQPIDTRGSRLIPGPPLMANCDIFPQPPTIILMSFSIRPDRRFPICCPVTYHVGLREGHGLVWNLSVNGWRFSGDVPLRVGQTCPLTINVPDQPRSSWWR